MSVSPEELKALRDQIDQVDTQLVELLAKRAEITRKVGEYKSKTGLPIYVPSREAELIKMRRQQGQDIGVSPDLVEDLLRRIMRESYQTQHVQYLCACPHRPKVVVIGGHGALGGVFVDMFERSGYEVGVIERDDWERADTIIDGACLVLVAVPIKLTEQVIAKLTNLPKDCVLADITSIKTSPLQAMLEVHQGPVVGLHPMFGPDVAGMVKQVVVVCHGREPQAYEWLLEQMRIWGAALKITTPQQHDNAMAYIQVMRHFGTFVYGAHLAAEDPQLQELIDFSSPIYRLELAMVGRLFAQDPSLYADIIFNNKDSIELLRRFRDRFDECLQILDSGDKGQFIKAFMHIGQWFGEYSKRCLVDSKKLLLKADDDRTL